MSSLTSRVDRRDASVPQGWRVWASEETPGHWAGWAQGPEYVTVRCGHGHGTAALAELCARTKARARTRRAR